MDGSSPRTRVLILRLSSLGDVILASAALQVERLRHTEIDWVVGEEYAVLLERSPRIRKVWGFNRKLGLKGWIHLCRELWQAEYHEVIDLHGSLRTKILLFLFRYWSIFTRRSGTFSFKRIAKQRLRLYAYYILKRWCPRSLRPSPVSMRSAVIAGGTGQEIPDLSYLVRREVDLDPFHTLKQELMESYLLGDSPSVVQVRSRRPMICIMPGSLWGGKRWSVRRYYDVIAQMDIFPIVLGGVNDRESYELVEMLRREKIPFYSGVGRLNLREVAFILSQSEGYLGNDTGLAHLAEAVGKPAWVIFGPTVPDLGFGPRRESSLGIGSSLWCRPCGKDGRYCFRIWSRYRCMKEVDSQLVIRSIQSKEKVWP